jgi:hypothetical protein
MFAPETGGGGGSAGFQGITTAVDSLVAAGSAGFALSENGGQPLIAAIQSLQAEVRSALGKSKQLEAQPPLGNTPNAKVYKPFLATIASDPDQGAITVLRKLQDDLNRAEAVVKQAMKNFDEADTGSATNINNSGIWT